MERIARCRRRISQSAARIRVPGPPGANAGSGATPPPWGRGGQCPPGPAPLRSRRRGARPLRALRSRRGCPPSPPSAAAASAGRARRDPPAPPRRCPRRPGDAPAGQRGPGAAQPPAAPPSRPQSLARPRRAAAAQSRPPPAAMRPRCLPLLALAIALAQAATFLSQQYASQFLQRKRRANSFMEESKKGNLERECIEELCNREEAREIFENNPETEYFYPKYLSCLASHRAGVFRVAAVTPDSPADLRACVKEISNQCSPLPCHKDGYKDCIDGQAKYTCVCKAGWRGENCEEDINECEDFNGGCSQRCSNFPGSFRCLCEDGYFMHSNKRDCGDINECVLHPNICGTAVCKNTQGRYECECPEGYRYNSTSKNCEDIDECAENICAQLCVNSPGSYRCYCDGKKGFKLSKDMKNCESVTECIPLNLEKNYQLLYLAEQFIGIPVLYLKFKLPNVTRFTAEFDFRTYDAEGVILYAESLDNSAWILLALRDGKIEIQFKNEFGTKVTSGGKAINDGLWHIVSVEELEHSISVKIAKEAVMSINSPGTLFKQSQGFLETKVYIAGLPRRVGGALVKQINPRLDGCIRAWNLMNQGHSGVNEVIQEKQSKHCLVAVGRGSFYPGTGMAAFQINYNNLDSAEDWLINVTLTIRPSTDTGVMFALVSNETVPLALSIVDSNSSDSQKITVTIGNTIVAQLESKKLCTPRRVQVELLVTKQELELAVDSHTDRTNSEQLSTLHQAMMANVVTYLGGLPDVPLGATPVTAFYNGCMEVKVNNRQLDLDEAISKHNDIRSHSCPLIMQ